MSRKFRNFVGKITRKDDARSEAEEYEGREAGAVRESREFRVDRKRLG